MGASVNFCQSSAQMRDLKATLRAVAGPLINFCCLSVLPETFHQLLSNCCVAVGPSVNFCQLSVQPRDCQHSMWPQDLLSTSCAAMKLSISFPCGRGTFRQPLSAFCVIVGLFIKFCHLLCCQGPSVNLRQLSVQPRDLLSTSIKFLRSCRTFRQLSVWTRDLP